jgi:hypothetical protein
MKTFTHECVSLKDYCDHNNLDYTAVMDMVASSDVSFGNNYDTLVALPDLWDILDDNGIDVEKLDDGGLNVHNVRISLGS